MAKIKLERADENQSAKVRSRQRDPSRLRNLNPYILSGSALTMEYFWPFSVREYPFNRFKRCMYLVLSLRLLPSSRLV